MKEKIVQSLKNKYANLGLSTETLEGVANQLAVFVKEETEIEPAVNGAENMLKSFQKFADSRVTAFKAESDKNKTEAEQLKARLAELEKKETPEEKTDDSTKAILEALEKRLKPFEDAISQFSSQRAHETLTQKLETLPPLSPKRGICLRRTRKRLSDSVEFDKRIKTS